VNASRGAASRGLMRVMGGAAAIGGLIACATSHPEQKMTVTSAEGHTVRFDSVTISYMAGGVQVIQRPNYANDVVAVHLYLLGGTRQLTPATQGIEALLLRASEYGTTHYPGGATREAWGHTGSEMIIDPSEDWTVYGFMGVRQDFDSSWNVWADRLMHPTLSTSAVSLVRGRMVSALRRSRDDPDSYVGMLADSITFAGYPYGLQPAGTEQTLATLDSAALSAYSQSQMVTSRMLLVVVGAVDRASVTAAVTRTLASLPHGTYAWTLPPVPPRSKTTVTFIQRPVATNYILGLFEGPPASESELQAFRVATAYLSSRMNDAVREERGLSYAASAPFIERGVSTGGIYVTTTLPGRVLPLIKEQIDSIRNIPIETLGMSDFTDQFIMDYYGDNMTDEAQADFLARAQLYRGDYHKATEAMDEVRSVSVPRMRSAADRYFRDIHFVYLGDSTRVDRSAFTAF